ncbi:MAG: hypothetical protein HYW48_04395 [Deltaproteobacteria bacterium]|nr:hypothetical protein [Deltaproteobacteria bacterium]
MEEPAAQFPPNHLLASSGLRIMPTRKPGEIGKFCYEYCFFKLYQALGSLTPPLGELRRGDGPGT